MAEGDFYDNAIAGLAEEQKKMLVGEALQRRSTEYRTALDEMNLGYNNETSAEFEMVHETMKEEMEELKIWRPEFDDALELARKNKFGISESSNLLKLIVEGVK